MFCVGSNTVLDVLQCILVHQSTETCDPNLTPDQRLFYFSVSMHLNEHDVPAQQEHVK